MMRVLALALALAACGGPVIEERIVSVPIETTVHPIGADDIPQVPRPLGPYPGTTGQALDLAVAKVCEFVAYALEADAALRTAAGLASKPLPEEPVCRDDPAVAGLVASDFDLEAH